MITCVSWSTSGDWLAVASNKEHFVRIWNTEDDHHKTQDLKLKNNMICVLKKHTAQILSIQFHTDFTIVTSSQDKSIIIWELIKYIDDRTEANIRHFKPSIVRRIPSTKFYLEIKLTKTRLICRKGNPNSEIKVIKFHDLKKDITAECFQD